MTSAMDREFYEAADGLRSKDRRSEIAEAVVTGIHRVSQLSAAMDLVTEESRIDLQGELQQELSYLRANTAELERLVRSQNSWETEVTVKDLELLKTAAKVMSMVSDHRIS